MTVLSFVERKAGSGGYVIVTGTHGDRSWGLQGTDVDEE